MRGRGGRVLLPVAVLLLVAGACRAGDEATRLPSAFEGFAARAFTVTSEAAARCALLAATEAQRARGLMGQRDLAGFDGMIFEFPTETTGTFWMRSTPLPLSIAWFRSDGRLVSTADMAPCADREDCRRYAASGPYRFALEVPQGALGRLGVLAPDARLLLSEDDC